MSRLRATPLVSVITPTFNRAELLEGALDSVAAQTYPAIEHIIVDGGSSDETVDLLKEHENRSGIRWISEPDRGMYEAINKGLDMAKGQVLAYLNSDDRYFPYSVMAAVNALKTDPTVGLVYGDLLTIDMDSQVAAIQFFPAFSRSSMLRGRSIPQPTAFWTRAVRDAIGHFDETLDQAADLEYWMRATSRFRAKHLEEVMALELRHRSRLSEGELGEKKALSENTEIVGRHGHILRGPRRSFWHTFDRLRIGLSVRHAKLRFLLTSVRPIDKNVAGSRWGGFLSHSPGMEISRRVLLQSLLPFRGRRYPSFLRASSFEWIR